MDVVEFNLMLKGLANDNKAFEALYDFYFTRIIIHIRRKFPDASADDVAQEFFLQLIKTTKFRYVKSPTAWVFACCDNIAKRMLMGGIPSVPLFAPENYSLSENFMEIEMLDDEMKHVFDMLGDECTKKIFYLYYWEGYNLREIAKILSLKPNTVKQRHARAINKLKNNL